MRLIDADILRDRINALEMLSTFKDSPSWPTYVYRTNEIDDVLDETPVVIEWHKPSEELPKVGRDVLFVCSNRIHIGYTDSIGRYTDDWTGRRYYENEVSAWCYALSLPEWCEEE